MNPEDLERFDKSIKDLDVFIAGFEKQAAGPNGDHYKEPLARLQDIRENIKFLKSGTNKLIKGQQDGDSPISGAAVPKLLAKLINTNQKNFKAMRAELSSVAELTGKIKPTVKKMEGMSGQILSLGRVSMEAADKLKKLVKDSQSPTAAPALDPKLIEKFADKIAEGVQKLELKVNAIGRGITKVDKDISKLPQQIDDQGDNFEVNFAAIESKVSGLLERADMGGVLDKLEPRLRNSEDGLKVLLDKLKGVSEGITENQTLLKADKTEETLEILESILDRQSAIETLSMVLTPLSQSYQDMSNSLKEQSSTALPEEFSEQFEELCERVDRNEELLEKILDRQGAIESLSMVLHPLSQSFQTLSVNLEEKSSVDEKIDALSRQMTALQAMVRNTYRKADKALASQPAIPLSKDDLKTMEGFEKPGPVAALEESEEMPWYVPKGSKKKKKTEPEQPTPDDSNPEQRGETQSDGDEDDGPVDLDSMDLGLDAKKEDDLPTAEQAEELAESEKAEAEENVKAEEKPDGEETQGSPEKAESETSEPPSTKTDQTTETEPNKDSEKETETKSAVESDAEGGTPSKATDDDQSKVDAPTSEGETEESSDKSSESKDSAESSNPESSTPSSAS